MKLKDYHNKKQENQEIRKGIVQRMYLSLNLEGRKAFMGNSAGFRQLISNWIKHSKNTFPDPELARLLRPYWIKDMIQFLTCNK